MKSLILRHTCVFNDQTVHSEKGSKRRLLKQRGLQPDLGTHLKGRGKDILLKRGVFKQGAKPEDTRAPSLFDTQLRTIFQSYRRERDRADRAAAGNPRRARERERAASQVQHTQHAHHRPGQLRRRLQGTMRRASSPGAANSFRASQESLRESFRESVRESVGESVRGSVRESVRDSADFVELARPIWDAPPPPLLAQRPPIWEPVAAITPLPTQPVPPAPELLGVAHVQRTRSASSLEQRLAILLPDAKPIRQDVLVCQSKPAAAVHMETEPPQVRSLSQRLSALLGESQGRKQHDSRCGKELLWCLVIAALLVVRLVAFVCA